jgi:hypothetical protein
MPMTQRLQLITSCSVLRSTVKKIGLAGHSEGGLIAPIVASRNANIAFIVSLAGPGVRGYDLILRQTEDIMRASGVQRLKLRDSYRKRPAL